MRVHYLQHVPFENLAYIEKWLEKKKINPSRTALFDNQVLPDPDDFDCLIIMGGPMGVDDDSSYPWMKAEKNFIEQSIKQGKTVVGICLGAQMIAQVLGARVFKNTNKEIGWFPIKMKKGSGNTFFKEIWQETFHAFHWHGDTFDIPDGAIHFAESEACRNQGFIYQQNVVGLQSHLESTKESIEQLILNCGDEIETPDLYIQSADEIHKKYDYISECNQHMSSFLDCILDSNK